MNLRGVTEAKPRRHSWDPYGSTSGPSIRESHQSPKMPPDREHRIDALILSQGGE